MKSFIAAFLMISLAPSTVEALRIGGTIIPEMSPGIVGALGCDVVQPCTEESALWLWNGVSTSATGNVVVDTDTATMDLDLSVSLGGPLTLETADGLPDQGVSHLVFSLMGYSAAGIAVEETEPNRFRITEGQTVLALGSLTQISGSGGGEPESFARLNGEISGECEGVNRTTFTCSLVFGASGFQFAIGDTDSGFAQATRFFQHELAITAIPEPSTAALLLGGLAGLTTTARKRRGKNRMGDA
ncbi:PEP-CTERM sorting domain-containing protein [Myxococcota bacterium]|nr:PEP-CTERM sorting domain-containing protein [Myxococcota bacterium]